MANSLTKTEKQKTKNKPQNLISAKISSLKVLFIAKKIYIYIYQIKND